MSGHSTSKHPVHGTWVMVKGTMNGEEAPDMVTSQIEVTLEPGRYQVRFGGQSSDEGELIVVPHQDGERLELRGTKGPNAGRILPALFQHRGELLRICYGLDGVIPDDFKAESGSARYLVLYRRKP